MYNVGDHVVYPMHGAGVIVAIEEREVLGERQKYYIMQLPIGDMKVMIPMNAVDDLGLRQVIGPEEVERVYQVLQGEETAMSSNWNRRYRANMEKIKSGDIYEVAEVVRNLTIRDIEKGLSTGAVSYTHLDVYKRQAHSLCQYAPDPRPHDPHPRDGHAPQDRGAGGQTDGPDGHFHFPAPQRDYHLQG